MDPIKLINPEFDIDFAGRTFKVHRANIEKVILFQKKMVDLAAAQDSSFDIKAAAYCLFLIIKDADQTITEEWISQNAPGDLDPYALFEQLGFLSRQKVEQLKAITQRNAPAQATQTGE